MSAALGLYRLQQVDSQVDQIKTRLKSIQDILDNDLELKSALEKVSSREKDLREANNQLKHSESDVQKQRIKIEQTESSLYSGTVKNPKELQDLQLESASLKKHLETLEERELDHMARTEQAEKMLADAKQVLTQVEANQKDQYRELSVESESLGKDLERLESERKAAAGDVEDSSLKIYSSLRDQKRGVAVALVSENACGACGATLTASQFQTARSATQLFNCPTCGRILYTS